MWDIWPVYTIIERRAYAKSGLIDKKMLNYISDKKQHRQPKPQREGGKMMYPGMEGTMCANCSHRDVCSLKEQFQNAQKAADDVMVAVGERSAKRLRDFNWIKRVKLECTHFIPERTTRDDSVMIGGNSGVRCMEDSE